MLATQLLYDDGQQSAPVSEAQIQIPYQRLIMYFQGIKISILFYFLLPLYPFVFICSAVNADQLIGSAAQSDILRMFQSMQSVSGLDPLHKETTVLRTIDQIDACLI